MPSGARLPGSDWWREIRVVWSHPLASCEAGQAGRRRYSRDLDGDGNLPWDWWPTNSTIPSTIDSSWNVSKNHKSEDGTTTYMPPICPNHPGH